MKLFKSLGVMLATGGLFFVTTLPAFAHHNGHSRHGYSGYNHKGYASGGRHHDYYKRHHKRSHGYKNNQYRHGHQYSHKPYRRHYDKGYSHGYYKGYKNRHGYNRGYNKGYRHGYGQSYYRDRPYSYGHYGHNRHKPRYEVGYRLRHFNNHVIHNYSHYGLHRPPTGYCWVGYDNDAYLAATGTGLIAGIVLGAILAD